MNTELLLLMFAIPGLLLSLRERRGSDVWAGVFFGCAIVCKQHGLLFPLVPLLWTALAVGGRQAERSWKERAGTALRRMGFLALGALIPIGGMVVYLVSAGVFGEFFDSTIRYVLLYRDSSSSWYANLRYSFFLGLHLAHSHPFLVAGAMTGIAVAFRSGVKLRRAGTWLTLWLVITLILAFAGGRTFLHYLQFCVPPMCALAMLAVQHVWEGRSRTEGLAALVLFGSLALFDAGNVLAETARSYVGDQNVRNYTFEWPDADVGSYLRANTAPEDAVFVLGPSPAVYYFSDRASPSRFVCQGPIGGSAPPERDQTATPAAVEELKRDLRTRAPVYIVLQSRPYDTLIEQDHLDWLQSDLDQRYQIEATIRGYRLYRLRSGLGRIPKAGVEGS